jgi:EAL domain-containing protein (putative c-di-GMP-specific phosphodiesterase class I)
MEDLEAIKLTFRELIKRNNLELAIWTCDRTILAVSSLVGEIILDWDVMFNAEAVIGIFDHQFVLHYQPIVRFEDGVIVGFEGLIRWNHPVEGFLLPGQFLDKMSNATMLLLTLEVTKLACEQLKKLPEGRWIAINLSPYDIHNRGFLSRFNAVVESQGIDMSRLRLEIAEETILNEPWMMQVLHALRAKGTILELDDFGTGYASLASILAYPISIIKVDRSLLSGIPGDRAKEKIFRLIIGMAEALGYDLIAEGV